MILGIAEDFSSNVTLDHDLTDMPSGGLYLNSGVHPCITLDNLLCFLPVLGSVFNDWSVSKTYNSFTSSRKKDDIVTYSEVTAPVGTLYQCIKDGSVGALQTPENTNNWVTTNIESLRIKSFLYKVQDRVLSDLGLTKRIVNNQHLYEVGCEERTLPNDYCGWVFEPKGSDYLTIRINQASIQKNGTTPVNLYVINQGSLVETLQLTPSNGAVNFQPLNYTFKGQGEWRFVIDSTDVISNNGWVDSLKYDGFTCYTCVGIGDAPETAKYSIGNNSNGLGFNVTAYLDPTLYIENNLNEFAAFIRQTFEYMTFQMYLWNANNRLNGVERIQKMGINLVGEVTDKTADTAVSRYISEKKLAIDRLNKTFDTQIQKKQGLTISTSSV